MLCSLGTLANEANVTIEIKVTTQTPGTLTNTANVLGMTIDPDTADNAASADTTVRAGGRPLAHQVGLARPGAGRRAARPTRSASTTPGPQSATGVTLTDTLPSGRDVRLRDARRRAAPAPSRAAR